MNKEINKWQVRTDLAYDVACEYAHEQIKGLLEETNIINGIKVVKNTIDEEASSKINKSPGIYYMIDLDKINYRDQLTGEKIEKTLSEVMRKLLEKYNLIGKKCLIVGLGNENVTPDAIGPYVVDNIVVTRHLEIMKQLHDGYSIVSALSPGVMGTTGIETYDVIEAVRNKIDVDYIIVVDALASSSISRVNRTIQITDSGIAPGSGVGNKRKEISYKTMNIPVFAIGIPTVVDAVSIVSDTLKYSLKYLDNQVKKEHVELEEKNINETFFGKIGKLEEEEQRNFFTEVLTPNGYNLMVTSKDIDLEVEDLSKIVAWGINKALHDSINANI